MKSRSYCLTIWEEPPAELPGGVRYAIYGKEICPETKKTHWQSYVEMFGSQRLSFIKKIYGRTVHAEVRKGTRNEAKTYCQKDGEYVELGKWISGQGHRSDLEEVGTKLIAGDMTLKEVMEETPTLYCKYRNGLKDLASAGVKKKTKAFRKVEVIVLSGPTGCGKTRQAMEEDPYKITGSNLNWWQDYDGEGTLLIDDYNNDVGITTMLNLLDGYQLRLNVKGSHTYANWTKVYITTNLKKDELHPNAKPAHREALFRRINKIENLWNGNGVPPR